jgi:mediator of RNA polymerase II transcription subunit 12
MPELRRTFLAHDIDAAKTLGQALYDRHGPYAGWATVWWGTITDVLKALSLALEGTTGVLDAIAAHVDQVTGFIGFTIDQVVGEWLDTVRNRYELFSAVSSIRQLFLMLVTRRRLSTLTLLDNYIYPLWKSFSATLLSSRPHLSPSQLQALDTTVILVQQLLLTKPPNPAVSPIGPQEAFIAYTSRSQVLSNHHMPDFIRHLPSLVVLGSITVPERTRDQISLFFRDLSTIPEFKTAAFRHLSLLKDAFLSSEWGKADPAVEGGMIETLKSIMSEGGSPSSSAMPSLPSSGRLSAWRWTSVVLEMRVEFKRLAIRLHEPGARDTLRQLVGESMHREHSADDAELLCETFKGIDAAVVGEIVAVGLDRLGVLLGRMMQDDAEAEAGTGEQGIREADKAMDAVLRIVCSAGTEGLGGDATVSAARHRMLDLIGTVLCAVGEQLGSADDAQQAGILLGAALKALRFTLGLNVLETTAITAPKPDFVKLIVALLRVLTVSTAA